ncbi:MAG: HAMP domain-containing protein [Betaproteobacteria bacterium]|nr:HAMP domain-containing protein [Betaproteobacteria bacterium]
MKAFFGSMVGRVFLILIGGIFASATLTFILADSERQTDISQIRSLHMAERVEQLVLMLDASPREAKSRVAAAANRNGFSATLAASPVSGGEPDIELTAALLKRIGDNREIVAQKVACNALPESDRLPPGAKGFCRAISLSLGDGTYLQLVMQPRRPPSATPPKSRLLLYIFFFAGCLALLAYAVARMSILPLRQLAQAAAELGRNIEQPPLTLRGPTEVRHAASAFNTMQAQIRRYMQERTQMLAAITHDLQTPLTRIRLRLEKVQDKELQTRLIEDLAAMQVTIRDGLDLARSMNSAEPMQRTDFDSILDSVCADAAETGQDVTLNGETKVSITARPNAMRRCLTNLIDNAVKYGGYARVTASLEGQKVIVQVRDGGLGIPEDKLEAVFDPFFRLETSRSRDTGGTGIGLTIARNIAEQHGGTLTLRNHAEGGLVAELELPVV